MKTRKQTVTMNENPCLWFNQTACKDWLASTSGKHRATLRMLEKLQITMPASSRHQKFDNTCGWCCLMQLLLDGWTLNPQIIQNYPDLGGEKVVWDGICSWHPVAETQIEHLDIQWYTVVRNVVGCFQPSHHKWYMCGKFAWAPNAPCNKSSFCNSDSRPHSSTWTRGTKEPILSDSARQKRTSQNPFDISNWG